MGFLFASGLYIGLVVGAVILYQVLAADVGRQLRQYATLKAVGHSPGYLYRVVLTQGVLMGLLAYLPALLLAFVVYDLVRRLSDLPMDITWLRAMLVLGLSVGMCMAAGLAAVRKVNGRRPG